MAFEGLPAGAATPTISGGSFPKAWSLRESSEPPATATRTVGLLRSPPPPATQGVSPIRPKTSSPPMRAPNAVY